MRRQGQPSVSPLWSRLGVGGLVGLIVGCQPPPPPPKPAPAAPPVATPEQAMMTQQQMMAVDPRARVGQVGYADPGTHLAVVTGFNPADIKVGDTVSFMGGSDRTPYAVGMVDQMSAPTDKPEAKFPIVKYQVSPGGRDPTPNDMVIMTPANR